MRLIMISLTPTESKRIDPLRDEQSAAQRTGRSIQTLRCDRQFRRGIPYLKIGHLVHYRESDIEAYLDSCRVEVSR